MRLQVRFLVIVVVFTILSSACEPATPTPPPPAVPARPVTNPDLPVENPALVAPNPGVVAPAPSTVMILSVTASPAKLGYAYKCGTAVVAPAVMSFTMVVSDPSRIVTHGDVWLYVGASYAEVKAPAKVIFLKLTTTDGAQRTFAGTTDDLSPFLADAAAGDPSMHLFWEAYARRDLYALDRKDGAEVAIATSCAPPPDAPDAPPPVPPGLPPPTKKPKEGEPPSCGPNGCPP